MFSSASSISGLIPKLEDPDSCYVRRRWDIHSKNVRWSNGIWASCLGADGGADESMSPQFGITIASTSSFHGPGQPRASNSSAPPLESLSRFTPLTVNQAYAQRVPKHRSRVSHHRSGSKLE